MVISNGPSVVAESPNAFENSSQKQELAQQLLGNTKTADGGVLAQLTNNPFFTAGFGLAGLGAAAAVTQRGVRRAATLIRRRLLVDVEIHAKDVAYPWFLYWMTLHERGQLPQKSLAAISAVGSSGKISVFESFLQKITPRMRQLSIKTERVELPNGTFHTHFALIPGPGKHVLRYKNAWIWVSRVRDMKQYASDGMPWETVTLTTLFSQRHIFQSLFQEAHAMAAESVDGKTIIYKDRMTEWERFGSPRRKRPLDSVILDTGIKERIVADVQDFINSATWYADRGIPYRRGYLLHGPPGTGKSSFIQALAGHLNYDIAMLTLSQRGLTDDRLNHLLSNIPERTLVLLEDVDAAFVNRRQTDADGYSGASVTFSGLLNALDGVASAEERIIFLTTNHVDRLDDALVRPGRVDMTVRLGEATIYQIENLWNRFYAGSDPEGIWKQKLLQRLEEIGVLSSSAVIEKTQNASSKTSTAALQGLFLYNKDNPEGAVEMAWQLAPSNLPNAVLPVNASVGKA